MKTILITLTLIIASLCISRTFFSTGFPYTHDGENHLARFANYKLALRQGQLPPRWAPNLFNGYGYPVFNYNYPLANILSLPFSFLKFNPETTFKLMVILGSLFGLVGVYRWMKTEQHSSSASLFAAVAFATSPVLISTVVYRGNIGEFLSMVLMPWVFFSLHQIVKTGRMSWFSVLVGTAFFLSHNLLVLFSLPIFVIYSLLQLKKVPQYWKTVAIYWLLCIGLSIWFWLPAILERSYTVVQEVDVAKEFAWHFPLFSQLVAGELVFGYSLPAPIDSMNFQLGILFWIAMVLSVVFLIKQRKKVIGEKTYAVFFLLLCMYFFFQLSVTLPIWQLISLSRMIQFPWRLSLFVVVLSLPLIAWVWSSARSLIKVILVISLGLQIFVVWQMKPVDFFHKSREDYDHFALSTSVQHENRSKTFEYGAFEASQNFPIIIGKGSAQVQNWNGTTRQYQLSLEEDSTVIEGTMNFPGWKTQVISSVDPHPREVKYIDSNEIQGRIAYQLPAGQYSIRTRFTQRTPARVIGNSITVLSVIAAVIILSKEKNVI